MQGIARTPILQTAFAAVGFRGRACLTGSQSEWVWNKKDL